MQEGKRYYWLKLKRDFFKRHDIQIIEAMPNGKDYVLFYLKLLVESVDHDGSLRFSDTIPYNEQMLSTITNTNIDTVRAAMAIFQELHLVEVLDDHTIYMDEIQKMVGSESWSAERMRRLRENSAKSLPRHIVQNSDAHVTSCDEEKEIEKDKELDKEIEKDKPAHPPRRKHGKYGWVLLTDEEHARLQADLGAEEAERCITYVDEQAQSTGNKNRWKDWNLTVRKCHRDGWGMKSYGRNAPSPATPQQKPSAATKGELDRMKKLLERIEST